MSTLAQIRSVLREYLALESEYKPIAEGWSRLQLRGAARKAWLKKTRARLDELHKQLSTFANAQEEESPIVEAARQCRACAGDGFLAIDAGTPRNEQLTRDSRLCTYCDGTGTSRQRGIGQIVTLSRPQIRRFATRRGGSSTPRASTRETAT